MHGAYRYRVLGYGATKPDAIERYKNQDRHQEKTPRTKKNPFKIYSWKYSNYYFIGCKVGRDYVEIHDALTDMAEALNLPPRALSLNGTLGLAFGARGRGGKNAPLAHYEPVKVVINYFGRKEKKFCNGDGARGIQNDYLVNYRSDESWAKAS